MRPDNQIWKNMVHPKPNDVGIESTEENLYVSGIRTRMREKGISLDEAIEEAKKEIEVTRKHDERGYQDHLQSLEKAAAYLKSLENK
jgi:hypothetical protein